MVLNVLNCNQIASLRAALSKRKLVLCFGAGVDSTAMLVALRAAGLRPAAITMADTGGEKPETWQHVIRINVVLDAWGWPPVTVVCKLTRPDTPYDDLYGNCLANETLPSLAFGMKSCSIKWKQDPQDQFLRGAKSGVNRCPPHPLWMAAQRDGERIVKLIGYDCGRADRKRSARPAPADSDFDYLYPLQLVGWTREDCVRAIENTLGRDLVPVKSACFFCPASKVWELFWLAAHHPDLMEQALRLEYNALTGRHSRFDELKFGTSWETLMRSHDRFPSEATCVGLGRSFSWCQWALSQGVADSDFAVKRDAAARSRFEEMSVALRRSDNAHDLRLLAA